MKTFNCVCGNRIYFENTRCLSCQRLLGYLPDLSSVCAMEPATNGLWQRAGVSGDGLLYRPCAHYNERDVCNWMMPDTDDDQWCRACRLNDIIPDLSIPENRNYWLQVERAKRRLIYTLDELCLPVVGKKVDPDHGLSFAFLADDEHLGEFAENDDEQHPVYTGHSNGLITINIAEANDVARAEMRVKMGEGYRTLLGHFRHEIGHYYWDLLVRDSHWLVRFREVFGDETRNYSNEMKAYYKKGPPANWNRYYISQYASMHPWEDWGESFAHYLHMYDTLETAHHFGFVHRDPVLEEAAGMPDFNGLMKEWIEFTTALNVLNRSMGLRDAYPFVIPDAAYEKLRLVSEIISSADDIS